MKHVKPFETFLNEDFTDVSVKFKDALDNLPQKQFSRAAVEELIKKHKEKRPDSAMAYAEKAYGWLMKESVEEINESDWGTYDTPEGKMVAKELEKAWTTFAKTVDAAHKEWLKTVQKYRGEAGKGSGFRDSEGRDAVISAMEWYIEKVFMADRRFGGIDYKKYRTLMGESVEVDEAIELFSLYTPIEFAREWSAAYGEDLQQEYSGLYKELLKMKRFTVLDIDRLWKKLYGEDFKKEYSALYKKLDK